MATAAALLIACAPQAELDSARIERIKSVLGLSYPYELQEWSMYQDGGSTSGVLIGADGKTLEFCKDGSTRRLGDERARNVYFGGDCRLGREILQRIAVGSLEEQALIDALRLYCEAAIGQGRVVEVERLVFDETLPVAKRLANRNELPSEERRVVGVLGVAYQLERQREK